MDRDTEEFEGGAGGSSISADLIRGHINTIILRSLYDRDKYGYEIINEINEKSHGQYTLKQPTLYSALKRLENQGYIQAYWKHDEVSAGGRRKYFRLTENGREISETNCAEWEYSRTVIDSLISDRNFDFSQPAPTPVDFKILKQATSRVPVVHSEKDEYDRNEGEATPLSAQNTPDAPPSVQDITIVAGTSDTVFIDDPYAKEKKSYELIDKSVSQPVYSSEAERAFAYSESIFSDGMPPVGIYNQTAENTPQAAVAEGVANIFAHAHFTEEDNTERHTETISTEEYDGQQPKTEKVPMGFQIPPDTMDEYEEFVIPPIADMENLKEEFASPKIAATRNEPQDFAMPSVADEYYSIPKTETTENTPQDFAMPSAADEYYSIPKADVTENKHQDFAAPSAANKYYTIPKAEATENKHQDFAAPSAANEYYTIPKAEPENKPQDFVTPTAANEYYAFQKAAAMKEENFSQPSSESVEIGSKKSKDSVDKPIYSLPSQSYAQAGASTSNKTNFYEDYNSEARRIAHENYVRLISGNNKRKDEQKEKEEAKNLVYNLRSEQERDYKNLIDKLFDNTINNHEPMYQPEPQPQPVHQTEQNQSTEQQSLSENTIYSKSSYFDAGDKAAADGLKINTSDEAFAAGSARQTTYNRGATLFKCSLIVCVIILLEFTLLLLFRGDLNIKLLYPIVILILGMALVLVCGILYGTGYGINVRKPTNLRYVMTMVIITVLAIAIILLAALVMNVNWTNFTDILTKIIIPIVIALNIPIFTLSFYLFTK